MGLSCLSYGDQIERGLGSAGVAGNTGPGRRGSDLCAGTALAGCCVTPGHPLKESRRPGVGCIECRKSRLCTRCGYRARLPRTPSTPAPQPRAKTLNNARHVFAS